MANSEELEIINGLRAGGITRLRYESILWKTYSGFIDWGMTKYDLPKDEVRYAYDLAICRVIINIVTRKYVEDPSVLLKTYVGVIFLRRCHDRIAEAGSESSEPITDNLIEMLPLHVQIEVEKKIEREGNLKMAQCLKVIGEICNRILQLYANGYKDQEIAKIMGYTSKDVAKQTRYRCLEKFITCYLNKKNCD